MFSGIIQSTGTVQSIEHKGSTALVTVSSSISNSLHIDQSIAHNGVCLTIINVNDGSHQVEIVNETLSKTNLGFIQPGQIINLEKSITLETLLDGHLIQGHVDLALTCQKVEDLDGSWLMQFNLPAEHSALIIPHGSICLNGVSLTVANLFDQSFNVAIIPYTYQHTNFKFVKEGDVVNAEFDLIGKYLLRQLELRTLTE
ncbi:MAG TPA: riboflavin synthase [Saprospiraceae bacterium]|nr:riboflavin synthase [Saprospiraceae bacterium]